jgi:hypothetical protein
VAKQPLTGGDPTLLDIGDNWVIGITKGHVITKSKSGAPPLAFAVPLLGATPAAATVTLTLAPGSRDIEGYTSGSKVFLHAMTEKAALYRVEGGAASLVFTATGARVSGVSELDDGTFVILGYHDTDGDGEYGTATDESDICFVDLKRVGDDPIEIPTRSVPLALQPVAVKLAALTSEPDLTSAKMYFEEREDGGHRLVLESPKDGPAELESLRTRVRAIQARVTELSGIPNLDVSVRWANAHRADSEWSESEKRFLSHAGFGVALVAEPKEYTLDVFPKVKTTVRGNYSTIGTAVCSGDVKNIGDAPLTDIEVTCTNRLSGLTETFEGKAKVAPSTLAPGAAGTYRAKIAVADANGRFTTVFTSGSETLSYYNSYTSDRAVRIFEVARKVFASTALGYFSDREKETGPSYAKVTHHVIVMRPSEAFVKLSADEQKARAESALGELAIVLDAKKGVPVVLEILQPVGFKTLATFQDGVLTAAQGDN